jgi:Fe-S cluster assembly scaffold protein SufB
LGSKINVGSKTIGLVDKRSIYKYYYVKISPVKAIGLSTDIIGLDESNIEIHEATYGHRNTRINSSIQIILKGKESRGYITTRGVVEENGYLNTTLRIKAEAPGTRGHIECDGLVLGRGYYKTNPSLETSVDETMLTHEASIGKISGEQLFYLQSRGLSEDEASKIIILGFLSSIFTDLPGNMRDYVLMAIKQITSYGKGF